MKKFYFGTIRRWFQMECSRLYPSGYERIGIRAETGVWLIEVYWKTTAKSSAVVFMNLNLQGKFSLMRIFSLLELSLSAFFDDMSQRNSRGFATERLGKALPDPGGFADRHPGAGLAAFGTADQLQFSLEQFDDFQQGDGFGRTAEQVSAGATALGADHAGPLQRNHDLLNIRFGNILSFRKSLTFYRYAGIIIKRQLNQNPPLLHFVKK